MLNMIIVKQLNGIEKQRAKEMHRHSSDSAFVLAVGAALTEMTARP